MGVLGKRKNKKFNYTPRYYKGDSEGSPFEMKGKFDEFRSTLGESGGVKNRLSKAWNEYKSSSDKAANRRILIIIAILILVFLFIIDFDLSIFRF